MAVKECKKEHTHLIRPETNYDYTQLKGAIKRNFRKYAGHFLDKGIHLKDIHFV